VRLYVVVSSGAEVVLGTSFLNGNLKSMPARHPTSWKVQRQTHTLRSIDCLYLREDAH
jgi:hypothetical protein